jgi:hypothetical protein
MEKLYIIVEVYVHNRYRIATRFLKALDCKSFCAKYCSQVPCPPEREGVLTKKKVLFSLARGHGGVIYT